MSNELTSLNHDAQLQADLKAGKITQAEVDRVWAATWDLSTQTPITVRRAVAAMREVSKGREPIEGLARAWPLFTQEVLRACTEMQAALMRDESKFAHLVAHTEDVVRELQKVGPLSIKLAEIRGQNEFLAGRLERLETLLTKSKWWQFWKRRNPPVDDDTTMDDSVEEAVAQEPYNARIGSSFNDA